MEIPDRYSTFLNKSLQKQRKISPSCRSLKAEDICGKISAARLFVNGYRHRFFGYTLNSLSIWRLDIWRFKYEGIGI